ncbi:hypothetical protein ILUMI_06543 [Ignelater luminosus]|uniref:OSK domain-containing protein n=1 Tax=Ignelater luminosus TaxID=2038154 RepID=A0A8K0D5J6_IGNLU|nr:hypothetical protein ILUMI_06543 [Ignelater luminosus]
MPMDELCQMVNNVYLDMESRFFDVVPYDSDDPDLYYGRDSEVESSSSQRSEQHSLPSTKDILENNSNNSPERDHYSLKKRKFNSGNAYDSNNTPSGSQSEYEIINQLVYANNINPDVETEIKTETQKIKLNYTKTKTISSDSEINENSEIIRKHRKLSFDSNNRKGFARNRWSTAAASTSTYTSSYVNSLNSPEDVKVNNYYNNPRPLLNLTFPPHYTGTHTLTPPTPELESNKYNNYHDYKKSPLSASSLSQEHHFTPPLGKRRSRPYNRRSSFNLPMPHYRDHQLLGDSQLLRFSEQILHCKANLIHAEDGKFRRLGYCVSGQTIKDLQQRILNNEYKLADKVIMLIGTNDMIQRTDMKSMFENYSSIIEMLKPKTERIVLLTVPPLPKFMYDHNVWRRLRQLNVFINEQANNENIFVVDLASLYISYSNSTSIEYFEPLLTNKNGSKKDLIHLNSDGFKMLKAILDIQYFDKVPFMNN